MTYLKREHNRLLGTFNLLIQMTKLYPIVKQLSSQNHFFLKPEF